MTPSRLLFALIVVVALASALFWTLTGEQKSPAALDGAERPVASATLSAEAEEGRPASSHSSERSERFEQLGRAEGRTELDPASAPVLELRFVSKAGAPIGGVGFELHVEGDRAEGRRGPRWSTSADEAGVAALAVVAGRALSVWVPDTMEHGDGELDIAALAPGERMSRTIELATGLDLDWYVRVEAGGRPVSGARVVGLEEDGQRARVVVEETATDSAGLASMRCRSWREREVLVQAPGIGLALVTVTEGHSRPADALVVSLWPTATLCALVLDSAAQPVAGAIVAVVVAAFRLGPPSEGVASYARHSVEARSDASGLALLEEVPAGLEFALTIALEGAVLVDEPGETPLPPGEKVERRYVVGVEGAVHVRVVDSAAAPVEGVVLLAVRASKAAGFPIVFDPARDGRRAAARAQTDAEGRATLEPLRLGPWNVGALSVEGSAPRTAELTQSSIAPFVDLTASDPIAVLELRLAPPLAIAGRLVDEAGTRIGGIRLRAHGHEVGHSRSGRSDSAGVFRLEPLPAGPFSLQVDVDREPWIVPRLERIEAGTLDLEIVLRRGGTLRGVVRDGATGVPMSDAIVRAYALASDRPYSMIAQRHAPDGAFEIGGLDDGAHALVAETLDGRIGLLSGVRVRRNEVTDDLDLRVGPGVLVRVRNASARESCDILVTQRGVKISYVAYHPGQLESFLAPPGPLEIRVEREGRAPELLERVAVAGEELEIVVE